MSKIKKFINSSFNFFFFCAITENMPLCAAWFCRVQWCSGSGTADRCTPFLLGGSVDALAGGKRSSATVGCPLRHPAQSYHAEEGATLPRCSLLTCCLAAHVYNPVASGNNVTLSVTPHTANVPTHHRSKYRYIIIIVIIIHTHTHTLCTLWLFLEVIMTVETVKCMPTPKQAYVAYTNAILQKKK